MRHIVGQARPVSCDDPRITFGRRDREAQVKYHVHARNTIDLRVALKPYRENALIDALFGVSDL